MAGVIQEISSGKNNKNRDILNALPLCMILVAGSILSWFKIAAIDLVFEAAAFGIAEIVLCLTAVYGLLSSKDKKWAFFIPAAGAAVLTFIRPVQILNGFLSFLNICIYSWNEKYEDGVRLFGNVQATEQNLFLYSLVFLLILAALLWYLVSVKACTRISLIALVLFVPEIVLGRSSLFGAVLMLTSITGVWLFAFHAGSFGRRTGWTIVTGLILFCMLWISGGKTSQTVLKVKKDAAQMTEQLRYGEDNMPSGNLAQAASLEQGDEPRLRVKTEQIKPLYLKGFTGSVYENDSWKPLAKAAYGGNRWGFLKWLNGRGFQPEHQYIAYEEAGRSGTDPLPEDAPWVNHIQVVNTGAMRKYIYEPYSSQAVANSTNERDEGSRSLAFFGAKRYEISELSSDMPGELQRLDTWTEAPVTDEQKQYLESEAVYRDFVYENYLTADPQLSGLIKELFHKEEEEASLSVYAAVQQIRTVLEENTYYNKYLSEEDTAGDDLLKEFLQGEREGNSAYYTSAAVLALRSFHIPARYAEGYLLTSKQTENSHGDWIGLSSSDGHAWAEVYMDGMGWVSVDVTPGFYYDTYALLNMAQSPGQVRKVAALDSKGEEAENLKKHFPGSEPFLENQKQTELKTADIGWGMILLILFVLEFIFAVLELRRMYYEYRIRKISDNGSLPSVEFLLLMIYKHLLILGIDMQPGFKSEQIQEKIRETLPEIPDGLYLRVNDLMEKYFYGGEPLEEYEIRLVHQFLLKLRDSRKKMGIFDRLRFRYCIFS